MWGKWEKKNEKEVERERERTLWQKCEGNAWEMCFQSETKRVKMSKKGYVPEEWIRRSFFQF